MKPISLTPLACLFGALLGLSGRDAQSATEVVPNLSISAETNDNPVMVTDEDPLELRRSASRLLAEATVSVVSFAPNREFAFEPTVRSDAYDNPADEEFESTDWFLRSRGRWDRERSRSGFAAEVSRQKILGTEFLDVDPGSYDDFVDVEGTLRGLNEQRTLVSFAPYTEIDFGERSRVRLDLSAVDAAYDDSPVDVRTDFTDWEAGVAYARSVTDQTDMSTRIFGGRYEAADEMNVTDKAGIEMHFAHAVSGDWTVGGGFGVERTEYEYVDALGSSFSGTETHPVLAFDLTKRGERSEFYFEVGRRARPDSFGAVVLRNELAAAWRRDFSPRVRGGLVLRAIDNEGLVNAVDEQRAELSLAWALTEVWSLLAGYEHSYWRNNVAVDTRANSNTVVIGANYRGKSRSAPR